MKTIVFDETSGGWHKHVELNEHFLRVQKAYIIDKLLYRGYIYLNEVYEALGVNWNPHNENVVWLNDGTGFKFDYEPTGDNAFVVKVRS